MTPSTTLKTTALRSAGVGNIELNLCHRPLGELAGGVSPSDADVRDLTLLEEAWVA